MLHVCVFWAYNITDQFIFSFQTVLVIAASHVRALVDGFCQKPPGEDLSFGYLSIPGGTAKEIRLEVAHLEVPEPDAVCIMGCSNNLTATTVEVAGVDFRDLLELALQRWPGRVCLSFIFICSSKDRGRYDVTKIIQ